MNMIWYHHYSIKHSITIHIWWYPNNINQLQRPWLVQLKTWTKLFANLQLITAWRLFGSTLAITHWMVSIHQSVMCAFKYHQFHVQLSIYVLEIRYCASQISNLNSIGAVSIHSIHNTNLLDMRNSGHKPVSRSTGKG